ncbi:hypothetical protein ACSAGD_03080 [Paramicrobacterium sp. CJ85]|uniref:hypothetical protein n=1 Tax=Paramicrobacterium sp. CJ85 TaxID=3445355 RepID=UPI003F615000
MRFSTLREATQRIDYGLTTSADTAADGPKFLRITDIDKSFIDWSAVPRCVVSPKEGEKYKLEDGDIVVARTGASTGRSQWVVVDEAAVFASYLVRFRANGRFDSRFLGYVLNSQPWRDYVSGVAFGKSAQPNMSASDMADFRFAHPEIGQQRAIAEVLGALDDKIAANQKRARVADDLARVSFRNSLGNAEVPLSETAEFVNGKAFTKDASGTGRVVVRIAELNNGIGGSTVRNDIEVDDNHVARPGDLLFAWSGSLTLKRWYLDEAIVNQHIFKVLPKPGFPLWLVHQLIALKLDEFIAIAANKATTMGHIQRKHLDELVRMPDDSAITRLDQLMRALWDTALEAELENESLVKTRDLLLPQLMSGNLRVRDAEKVVSDAV